MRTLLAIFMPWTVFFTIRRPFAGVFCLLLQLTLIGWIPAAMWATHSLGQFKSEKALEKKMQELEASFQANTNGQAKA